MAVPRILLAHVPHRRRPIPDDRTPRRRKRLPTQGVGTETEDSRHRSRPVRCRYDTLDSPRLPSLVGRAPRPFYRGMRGFRHSHGKDLDRLLAGDGAVPRRVFGNLNTVVVNGKNKDRSQGFTREIEGRHDCCSAGREGEQGEDAGRRSALQDQGKGTPADKQ